MVTLGSDSHKRAHTLVAVDGNGHQLSSRTVMATGAGHSKTEALRKLRRQISDEVYRRLWQDHQAASAPPAAVAA